MRHINDTEDSYVDKATGTTHSVAAPITKPDDQRARGHALEPAFRALLDAKVPKMLIRPKR